MNDFSETPALTSEVKAELEKLIKLCRILEIEGHGDRTLGFASVRDPHGNGMWIKRSHIALGEVFDYRDFFHIGLDGKVHSGEGRCHGEWPIHASIFEMRPDINAAIHTHPLYGCVVSSSTEPMRPAGYQQIFFPTPPPRYEGSSELIVKLETGREAAKIMGDSFCMFLRNHGVVACGTSIEHALVIATAQEAACEEFVKTSSASFDWSYPNDDEQARKIKGQERNVPVFWEFYCRKLTRAEALGHPILSTERIPVT